MSYRRKTWLVTVIALFAMVGGLWLRGDEENRRCMEAAGGIRKGMSRDELRAIMGKPSVMYSDGKAFFGETYGTSPLHPKGIIGDAFDLLMITELLGSGTYDDWPVNVRFTPDLQVDRIKRGDEVVP